MKIFKDLDWKYEFKQSLFAGLWFMFLTFPLMVMKVSTLQGSEGTIYRWRNMMVIGPVFFVLSFIWRRLLEKRGIKKDKESKPMDKWLTSDKKALVQIAKVFQMVKTFVDKNRKWIQIALIGFLCIYPLVFSMYQTNVMISVLIYVILGLGLNIVVGYGGILHLGYAAFYLVGAYTYALFFHFAGPVFEALEINTGWMFWISIPASAILSMVFGILLCLPVIRLKGDYLAIVTLAFGEILRMVVENWGVVTQGPSGISQIPRPWLLGLDINPMVAAKYIYYIAFALVVLTIIIVKNLENSRIGRAWEAMREDDIAAESMGIDLTRAKLKAFALGALWAGMAGVLLAAKTTFVNPASFTLWESVIILCVVVLGGMGSIPGVIIGALLMIILPEYFRFFSKYRMLIFGIALVIMMIFRSGGIIPRKRKIYTFPKDKEVKE